MPVPTVLTADLKKKLMQVAVPTVVSILWRRGYKNTLMFSPKPLNPNAVKFVGSAVTVRTIAAREDVVREIAEAKTPSLQNKVVNELRKDDVLVVAMGGETRTAFMGDIMTTYMMVNGVAGVVLDGAVSDAAAISGIDIPVFCTGNAATPLTSHRVVVEIDCAIDCAGVPVYAGDIVMGDANGVVVIPAHIAEEVAQVALDREVLEEFVVGKVRAGAPLVGTYPPNEQTLAEFEAWKASRA